MRFSIWLAGLALAASTTDARNLLKPRNFDTHDYYTLHLQSDESPQKVARALGLVYEGPLGELDDHYYFSAKRGTHNAGQMLDAVRRRRRKRELIGEGLDGILWSRKQKLKQRMQKRIPPLEDRQSAPATVQGVAQNEAAVVQRQQVAMDLHINDPEFNSQWHLFNTVELGHDLNVSAVWTQGITGHNATVAIVDDGLDMYSDDLRDNYFAKGSYDFNEHVEEPRPRLSDDHHGTRCAGEVAAVKNNACGVGVAYDSKVAGIRILSGPISDEDEALAINYGLQDNHIYSCSWGPPDDGKSMDAPDLLIKRALQTAIQKGRNGLGSIFVFASGNGASREDNCNFDGYTNSIYSITVGALDRKGQHPYYSEKCSASLVVTYSSGSGDAIHTTDVGTDKCTSSHGGTSAAAPIGAGLFALALSIRPDLSWRDLQYLCVNTAVPINLDDADGWQDTYIGKKYSHTFAYGKLDAYAYIEAAKDWTPVKPQAWFQSPWQHINHPIPQGDQGLASGFKVTADMLKKANVERLEHVQVTMNVEHQRRGELSVELLSPEGITSHLSATRRFDDAAQGYINWTFMSVLHWGELGVGNWTVIVKDTAVNENTGTFTDWRLTLWGEAIDGGKQELFPMPTEEDEHDPTTDDAQFHTTSIKVPSSSDLQAHPTDHPDRPVNAKPTKPSTAEAVPTPTEPTHTDEEEVSKPGSSGTASPSPSESFLLPSIFPTFGVSPRTQIWIYGAIATILIFCIALGSYLFFQRRRKRGIDRDDYEFAILQDEDAGDGPRTGMQKRRGGELYDAFAGESDEEEHFFSDEEEHGGYHDDEKAGMLRTHDGEGELGEKAGASE